MKLIESIQNAVLNYIISPRMSYLSKRHLLPSSIKDEDILNYLRKMEIRDEKRYGLFTRGDDGLKRAKFLLLKLDEWKHLNEKEILINLCMLYAEKKEPPFGLGKSTELRYHLTQAQAMSDALDIKRGQITDEEIKIQFGKLYSKHTTEDGEVVEYIPDRETVIKAIMYDKVHLAILKLANAEKFTEAFSMAYRMQSFEEKT